MTIRGSVDWRGAPINRAVHGGVRAAWFIYLLTVVTNMVNVPNLLNLVTYLQGTMHMGVLNSATTVTNFVGAISGFALIGAFLSDSYITRSRTILLFGPLYFLGYGLLALQAHLPSLRPPPCNIEAEPSTCEEVHGWNATLLYAALYISAFGDGCMRACIPPLGADQFDHEVPSEARQQSSFFNWYTFGISLGGFVGLIAIVWLQNYKGWDTGLSVCTILILVGLVVVAAGLPFYRNQLPEGSPLTRMLQVLVVAFRNRRLELPEKLEEAQQSGAEPGSVRVLFQTNSLKFVLKVLLFPLPRTGKCLVTQTHATSVSSVSHLARQTQLGADLFVPAVGKQKISTHIVWGTFTCTHALYDPDSRPIDSVVGVRVGDEVALGGLEDGGDRQQLVGRVHLQQAPAAGRGLHLDVRRRRLDRHADAAALHERRLALALVEVQALLHQAERHGWGEVELPDAADAALALHGVGAGDDVGGDLGGQGVPVHHGGAEQARRGHRRRDLQGPAAGHCRSAVVAWLLSSSASCSFCLRRRRGSGRQGEGCK